MATNYCDVCGKPATGLALIEGVRMRVCPKCARHGKPLFEARPVAPRAPGASGYKPAFKTEIPEVFVVDGYSNIVRVARESKGMEIGGLAKKLFINEAYLRQIEAGLRKPDEKVGRKLEAELGVKLYAEAPKGATAAPLDAAGALSSGGGLTLGDIVSVKKRKQ